MENHKSSSIRKLPTYRPKTLTIKQKWGLNNTDVSTGWENVMGFGSISISATCTIAWKVQVYYNNLLKGGEANKVLIHTFNGTANVPFFVCLPIKGEVVQLVFSGRDAGDPPIAATTILVSCMLGNSSSFKVIP